MLRPFLILSLSFLLLNCTSSEDKNGEEDVILPSEDSTCPAETGNTPSGNNDVLIWADEFNEDGSPCSKKLDL